MFNVSSDRAQQAFRLLQIAFVVAPILAGLDKFFYLLADWSNYLSPFALRMLDGHDRAFFAIVGVVEIIAGLGVLFRPRIFAYVVSLWLLLIVINLLMTGHYFDIALRDIGLMLSAFALGRLAQKYDT
ncbi:MAG TPA: hypothetical protein VHK67_03980 [Rhabdochlamydiaceae bacterium]|jgi:hypothetical protein|nr:hypothetical protein [Rhabdochlamydiaceae bacterium]